MDIRRISDTYAVSPQIDASDVALIAEAGFGTIICNRPDAEVMPMQQAAAIEEAAKNAGLAFVINPVTHQGLNMSMVTLQRETIETAGKPVFAYCASGTRSTIVWALGQAGNLPTDDIVTAAMAQGYDIAGLRPQIDSLAGD